MRKLRIAAALLLLPNSLTGTKGGFMKHN